MSIKRIIAKQRIKARKRQAEKHEKEMREYGLARNKALREAEVAAERASALEAKRKAEEKRAKALAPLEAEKRKAREQRKKQAKKTLKGIGKALKPVYKVIKGKS